MDKNLQDSIFPSLDLNSAPLIHTSGDSPNVELEADLVRHGSKPSLKGDQSGHLVDELNRMKSENRKLSEMLFLACENYSVLRNHMMDLMNRNGCTGSEEDDTFLLRKRKHAAEINSAITLGNNDARSETIFVDESPRTHKEIRTNISRFFVRTQPADSSLLVKDGYHWRKYGQKVTKDNPSPRAYFKCSFAPNCQVKKKVQRSVGDPSILVATYEGEHNHPNPLHAEMLAATSPVGGTTSYCKLMNAINEFSSSSSIDTPKVLPNEFSSSSSIDNPKVLPAEGVFNRNIMEKNYLPKMETDGTVHQKLMAEQMAASLTRNPRFTAALVAAISGQLFSHDDERHPAEE